MPAFNFPDLRANPQVLGAGLLQTGALPADSTTAWLRCC